MILKSTDMPNWAVSSMDKQIGGSHYKSMKIQPVEFITANNIGFCEGNAIKYICRHKSKGGIEDLEKAKHYIEILIEQENKNNMYTQYPNAMNSS